MANAFKCDGCNQFKEGEPPSTVVFDGKVTNKRGYPDHEEVRKEICLDCSTRIFAEIVRVPSPSGSL